MVSGGVGVGWVCCLVRGSEWWGAIWVSVVKGVVVNGRIGYGVNVFGWLRIGRAYCLMFVLRIIQHM